ncbi:hypothetical protein J6590_081875 [Homalodisca vitripennis]|nr:hypothetical protein J6590_081875 [Homalodisca vitripennis]
MPYTARPHGPLACARILSNRKRGESIQYKDSNLRISNSDPKSNVLNRSAIGTPTITGNRSLACQPVTSLSGDLGEGPPPIEIHEEELGHYISVMSPRKKERPSLNQPLQSK